jgi:hypothetical protein
MPQLDLGIFILESFINSYFFWFIYLYKAFLIFPLIMKIIKFRLCNNKLFFIKLWYFLFKLIIIINIIKLTSNKFKSIITNMLLNYIYIYNKIKLLQINKYYSTLYIIIYNVLHKLNFKYINNKLI